jgi:hypothetical protein
MGGDNEGGGGGFRSCKIKGVSELGVCKNVIESCIWGYSKSNKGWLGLRMCGRVGSSIQGSSGHKQVSTGEIKQGKR